MMTNRLLQEVPDYWPREIYDSAQLIYYPLPDPDFLAPINTGIQTWVSP